jgi:hypothetical protein
MPETAHKGKIGVDAFPARCGSGLLNIPTGPGDDIRFPLSCKVPDPSLVKLRLVFGRDGEGRFAASKALLLPGWCLREPCTNGCAGFDARFMQAFWEGQASIRICLLMRRSGIAGAMNRSGPQGQYQPATVADTVAGAGLDRVV